MEVEMEVLIPLAVLLMVLIIVVIILICRYYVCTMIGDKKRNYRRLSMGSPHSKGYPLMPNFPNPGHTAAREQQIPLEDQFSNSIVIPPYRKQRPSLPNGTLRHESLPGTDSDDGKFIYWTRSPSSSAASGHENSLSPPLSEVSAGSERSYPSLSKPITKQYRGRFRSEPTLTGLGKFEDTEKPNKRRPSNAKKPSRRPSSTCLSVISPAGGQVEFGLYYETETRTLDITVNQLLDLTLRPETFLSVLEVYEKHERPKSNKVYLKKRADGSFELSDSSNMAFLVYVTLLPKRTFRKHTNVVFGTGNVVFNEKLSITGYSTEQLAAFQLCFHALCKLGRDGEPIVLGEVIIPLKRLQTSKFLPFVSNLKPPTEVLEIENYLRPLTDLGYLDVFISFNPIAQKLIVKIVQAVGLPKIGVTGHPNVAVKTSLYYCNNRINKKTTGIKKRARDPVYNYTFEFELSKDKVLDCDLLCEVRHHGPMYRTVIGYVTIGSSAGGEGEKHWKSLIDFSSDHEKRHQIMAHKPIALL